MEHNKVKKFYETIKSRMLVAEVIERIRAGGKGRTAITDSEFSAIVNVTLLLKSIPVCWGAEGLAWETKY